MSNMTDSQRALVWRHMYEVSLGQRNEDRPHMTDILNAKPAGCDKTQIRLIIDADHKTRDNLGMPIDREFDQWVETFATRANMTDYWQLSANSVSFTGRHIAYGQPGQQRLTDRETRMLTIDLWNDKIRTAMSIARLVKDHAYPTNRSGLISDDGRINHYAARQLLLMHVNPIAIRQLLDDYLYDKTLVDDEQLVQAYHLANIMISMLRDEHDDGFERNLHAHTLLTYTGLLNPDYGMYQPTRLHMDKEN